MANRTVLYFKTLIKTSEKLKPKEKEILLKRLDKKTLQKIGRKYKISAERVRQIEEYALYKFMKKVYQLMLFEAEQTTV